MHIHSKCQSSIYSCQVMTLSHPILAAHIADINGIDIDFRKAITEKYNILVYKTLYLDYRTGDLVLYMDKNNKREIEF